MKTDLESDRTLARRAGTGEEESWRLIYERTCDRLFALLCFQTGDRETARDLLQETYLQAFRRISDFRGDAPIEVWLRRIAFHKAIDWKRVFLNRIKRTVALTEAAALTAPDDRAPERDSDRAALHAALARLSPKQRAVFLLREWEDRSFAEIALLVGCSESTARVHHTRARERMRAGLEGAPLAIGATDWEGRRS